MCTTNVVKAAHFSCPQSEREMFSEANSSLAALPPSATNGFDSHDTGGQSFLPKKPVKICLLLFCHHLFFSHSVQMLVFSCKRLNSKWKIAPSEMYTAPYCFSRKVRKLILLFHCILILWKKERKLWPDTSNFKTHTHKENSQNLFGKKTALLWQAHFYR